MQLKKTILDTYDCNVDAMPGNGSLWEADSGGSLAGRGADGLKNLRDFMRRVHNKSTRHIIFALFP